MFLMKGNFLLIKILGFEVNALSINIIIKEYLNSSNFFLEDSQTKYLNALLDDLGKKLRSKNA